MLGTLSWTSQEGEADSLSCRYCKREEDSIGTMKKLASTSLLFPLLQGEVCTQATHEELTKRSDEGLTLESL